MGRRTDKRSLGSIGRYPSNTQLIGVDAFHSQVEDSLYASAPDEQSLYPPYMIIGTSSLGLVLVLKLHSCGRIAPLFSAIVSALCVAKLFVLIFPEENSTVVPAIMVLFLSGMPAPAIRLLAKEGEDGFQMTSVQVRKKKGWEREREEKRKGDQSQSRRCSLVCRIGVLEKRRMKII